MPSGYENGHQITQTPLLILSEADRLGISWRELPGSRIIELSYKGKLNYFRAQDPFNTSYVGWYAVQYKDVTKNLLNEHGIMTPKGYTIEKKDPIEHWRLVFNSLSKPLVVKPNNGAQGKGVFMNISDFEDFKVKVVKSLENFDDEFAAVVVEEMFQGSEYRVLVTRKKIIGITNRVPANVVGDGESTIEALIKKKNSDPRRKDDPTAALVTIKVDENVLKCLADKSLSIHSVPALNEQVLLRYNSNISTGGDSIDYTEKAHESVRKIAMQTIHAIPGLEICGIDFMSKDILAEQNRDTYRIVEVNHSPGFSIHDMPYEGKNRHAAREFLNLLFPELENL